MSFSGLLSSNNFQSSFRRAYICISLYTLHKNGILLSNFLNILYVLICVFLLFFFPCSFSLLWGPMNHLKHLCSAQRFPFTATYFGTMFATLYFSMIVSLVLFKKTLNPGSMTCLKYMCTSCKYVNDIFLFLSCKQKLLNAQANKFRHSKLLYNLHVFNYVADHSLHVKVVWASIMLR